MTGDWSDIGVEWALLALRVAFIAVLYLFLIQVARLMLREIRVMAAPRPVNPVAVGAPYLPADERGLIVLDPGQADIDAGAYVPIAGEILIGRGGQTDLYIDDPFVSNEHAQIIVRNGSATFIDLGSTNGSRVNGEIVSAPVTLFDGDVVQLGSVRLRYAATVNVDRSP
ncbi:MAG: FHA domain-containing protein [Thermomicrobiales bacterium]|nr:FHA domain-containing protein [Thermomicrobiales bacterium]